jgi:hypothetical protein
MNNSELSLNERLLAVNDRLKDLIEQATKERSHYYVKSVAEETLQLLADLDRQLVIERHYVDKYRAAYMQELSKKK